MYPSAPPAMTWVQPSALSSVMTFVPTPMVPVGAGGKAIVAGSVKGGHKIGGSRGGSK